MARLVNGPTRRVVLGAEKTILVRVMEREVRLVIRGVIYTFDDQLTSIVRCHIWTNFTPVASKVPCRTLRLKSAKTTFPGTRQIRHYSRIVISLGAKSSVSLADSGEPGESPTRKRWM